MVSHEERSLKGESFQDIEELTSGYESESDDLPLFETKYQDQTMLEHAMNALQAVHSRLTEQTSWRAGQSCMSRYRFAACLALISVLGLVFFARLTSHTSAIASSDTPLTLPLTYNRILSASMLFGFTSPTYKRAIETHKRQAQRWGYQTEILERDEGCGFWTKMIFLLNLVGQELQKPNDTRAEWIMWADADALILNPNIPLSIFLPPEDLSHIHFIGNKDWNGLNTGVFFVRVHPWTLIWEVMRRTFERENGGKDDKGWRSGIVFMPRKWFNAYDLFQDKIEENDYYKKTINTTLSSYPGLEQPHRFEGSRGSMVAHFPGTESTKRQHLMEDWLDMVDEEWSMQYGNSTDPSTNPEEFEKMTQHWDRNVIANNSTSLWTLPIHEVPLLNETTAFWTRYREAMALSSKRRL